MAARDIAAAGGGRPPMDETGVIEGAPPEGQPGQLGDASSLAALA
jgi:hypothetical protein